MVVILHYMYGIIKISGGDEMVMWCSVKVPSLCWYFAGDISSNQLAFYISHPIALQNDLTIHNL